LVDTEEPNLWRSFKGGILKACDEICGVIPTRQNRGNTWWWNDEVNAAIAKNKVAFQNVCKNRSAENLAKYKYMRNQTRKIVAQAIRNEARKEIDTLQENPNSIFRLKKILRQKGNDEEGGSCIRGKDGRLGCNEIVKKKIWRDHFEKIMNEENDWDQTTEVDVVEGPVEKMTRVEIVKALKGI